MYACVCVGRENGHNCFFVHRGQNFETDVRWTWNLGWGPARRAILWPQAAGPHSNYDNLVPHYHTWMLLFILRCHQLSIGLNSKATVSYVHTYTHTHIHAYNKITRDSWWHYFLLLGIIILHRRYSNVSEVRVNKRKTGQKWCFICLLHPEHGRDSIKY